MKNTNFLLTALLMSALVAVSFTSCKSDDDDDLPSGVEYLSSDSLLIGTWVNKTDTYTETYKITETMFSNGYYEGNNLTVIESSDSSGYIYIKYTKAMNADWSYSENAPDVGKWYAISYKNLTDDTVSISGAYKSGGATSTETLDEAVSEFTIENGYFGTYSDCTRQ
ncbi:hypothetical protein [uncultured Treponema sp.]|uniref:hypothetical protein n=1 Tax=uncultured Treponema sp. TaxID=162155 RepID=UPI0025887638|nr:hypothetical protein [uncultured Treponema sp.]